MSRITKATTLAILGVLLAAMFAVPMFAIGTTNEKMNIKGGTLTGVLKADVPSSDPTKVSDENTWAVLDLVYDSLSHTDPKSGAQYPLIADSWEVSASNQNNLTVKLKQGVKFHDGSTMNADDVVATYANANLQANPKFAKGFPTGLAVTKLDESTVVFSFAEKPGRVYAHTLSVPILPDGKFTDKGTGAYKIESWTPGTGVTLAAFSDAYYKPNLDKIVYKIAKASGNDSVDCAAGKGMVKGDYDFATWFISPTDMSCYQDVNVRVTQEYGKEFTFIAYNSAKSAIGTKDFRQGAALSTLKQFIVATVLANSVLMSSSVISPVDTDWYVPNLPNYYMMDYNNDGKPDPAEFAPAIRVLDAGGYIDVNGDGYRDSPGSVWNTTTGKFDKGGTITLTVSAPSADAFGDPQLSLIGMMVQEPLAKLGMKATLKQIPTTQIVSDVMSKSYDIAILKSSFFGTNFTGLDPTFVYDLLHSKGAKNYFGYQDMDGDLDAMEMTMVKSDRMDATKKVLYGVAENLPMNVLYYLKSLNAYRTKTSANKAILGLIDSAIVGVWSKESLTFAHLDSRGKLNIGTSLPTAISSGGTGDITITLTDGFAIPVAGGDVTFTIVSGGGDIAASGKTDANGKLTVTYTAPSVTSATDIVISVAATASLADDGATIIMLSVIPPPLISPVVLLESSSSKIKSEESTTISINVTAAGKPLAGAYVTLVAEKGLTLNTTSGTTDSNGKMTVTATGNADVYNTRAKVTAIVYKPGYLQASSETTIQIDPKSDTASTPINVPGFETAMAIASIGLAFVLFTAMAMATRRRK